MLTKTIFLISLPFLLIVLFIPVHSNKTTPLFTEQNSPTPTPTPTPPPCPVISVDSSTVEQTTGTLITFTANVSGGDPDVTPTYNWSVSVPTGTLYSTSGQGTPSFTVEIDEPQGQSITATVEVGGYSPTCPSSASISVTVATHPDQTLITGVVKEQNGPDLSGVSVKAIKRRSSFSASDTTGADGRYILKPLETGIYLVTASKDGYQSQTKSVELRDAGDQVELNFELKKR